LSSITCLSQNISIGCYTIWIVYSSPSRIRHLRSSCPVLTLHYSQLPHLPHCWKVQYRSDCLRSQLSPHASLFSAPGSSISRFQLFPYLPTPTESLPVPQQLPVMLQWFPSQHSPPPISLSLHCMRSAFLIFAPPQASFWIASCAKPQPLGLSLRPSRSCTHSLDDIILWNTVWICHNCQSAVAKCTVSEHWPLQFVLTLVLGKVLDVGRDGQYGGKMCILFQDCYGKSSWTQPNLASDCQLNRNS
jgi:hypothetical protein